MKKEEIIELKKELQNMFSEEISSISRLDNKACNVFKIVGCENDELKHSNFTRWLLYNDYFYKRFLLICGIKLSDDQFNEPRIIKKEESYNIDELNDSGIPIAKKPKLYNENDSRRRIDLNIIGKTYSITIENKVDTGEHNDQCISYFNYMMDSFGKYKDIKDKYFVFLTKNDIDYFEEKGGLIKKKGEDIVEKKVDILKENLNAILELEIETNDKIKKLKDSGSDSKINNEIKKLKDKLSNEIRKKKMSYFNYRLVKYESIKALIDDENFKKMFREQFESTNSGDDVEANTSSVFVMEILRQYSKLIGEWIKLPSDYREIFDVIDSEKEDYLYLINQNYNLLYDSEKESDFGRFLEIANRYYLEKKRENDSTIAEILRKLAKERVGKNLDLDSYGVKYGKSIKVQGKILNTYLNTIDYLALNNITVRMLAGLKSNPSRNLFEFIKEKMQNGDFSTWYENNKNECNIKLGWAIRKTQESTGSEYDVTFIEYDIDKILNVLNEKGDVSSIWDNELIFVDKFYINCEEALKRAEEAHNKKINDGEKSKTQQKHSVFIEDKNRIISFIDTNIEYIKNAEISKEAIEDYQDLKKNKKECVTSIFAVTFELHVIYNYSGDKKNKNTIKTFFETSTDKAVGLFGASKADIFNYNPD